MDSTLVAQFELTVSPVMVAFQATGALVLFLILWRVARSTETLAARIWAWGWLSLFVALVCVRVFIATGSRWFWLGYLLAEWLTVALFYSGGRQYAIGSSLRARHLALASPVAFVAATLLIHFSNNFNTLFSFQAAVLLLGFTSSFLILRQAPASKRGLGWQLAHVTLMFAMALFALYVPLFWLHGRGHRIDPLVFAPMLDFLVEIVLGFGMVLMANEEARRELDQTVRELAEARDRLELTAKTDPLTNVLNRHAFYSMIPPDQTRRALRGSAVMVDLDQLKKINDTEGHEAGDAAIRAAANTIRRLIRADDLLFRWGGDEFVALLPGLDASSVAQRFESFDTVSPTRIASDGTEQGIELSWGVAEFGDGVSVQDAIAIADAEMYRKRSEKRSTPRG